MKELVIVAVRPVVLMPPPEDVAWLLLMVLEATFSVPWLKRPPPTLAELPLTVLLVSVVVPTEALSRPPPLTVAELPLTVELGRVVVPAPAPTPPPYPAANTPPP